MSARPKAAKHWFVGAGYAGLLIVFGGIIGGSLWQARHIRSAIAADNIEISRREASSTELAGLQQKIKLIELQVHDYDRLVSPGEDLADFLKQLNQARDQVGLNDLTISTLVGTSRVRSKELPIAIRGTGTFQQFHEFLERLEKMPRMSSVKHLSVEAADPAMNGKVLIELTLSIYSTKTQ